MSNDLITFEERINNWQTIHPRQWIATTNRNDVANFLSTQTEKIIESQVEVANSIIVSQARIAGQIDISTRDITEGFQELQATFDWGFTELIWQIEQEREVLKDILKVLQAPLDTQAKELKKRAEYAYQNGWIGDALKDFLESEKKNRYDFTIHQNLGNIYLFEKKAPDRALEYYEKAVKYATPKSSYYTSISLLHKGLVKYLQKDFKEAYKATLKSIEVSPDFYEAHYQHAQYCASLGKYNEAIKHLKKAIVEGDKYYCVKADSEKDFDVMKEQLKSLFKELQINAQNQVTIESGEVTGVINRAKSYYNIPVIDNLKVARGKLEEAKVFIARGSFFDCHDAARKIFVGLKTVLDFSVEYLSNEIKKKQNEINASKNDAERKINSSISTNIISWVSAIIFFIFYVTVIIPPIRTNPSINTGILSIVYLATPVFPCIVYGVVKILLSDYDDRNRSLQIAPLKTRKNELENKLLKAKDKQNEFYIYTEEELKNEKDPEKLEKLLQKKYMSILGLIKITKTGKENKKEIFTVDLQKYFRQKRRATEEKKVRRKKSTKEMTDDEFEEWLDEGEEEA
jgi:tetratricopeptide (TPR) repeat protein